MKGIRRYRKSSILLLFSVLGGGLYLPALDSVFTYDDYHQIVQNPSVWTLWGIPSFFTEIASASRVDEWAIHYRPLLLASFALNYAVGGTSPAGYHLVNLCFHVGSSFLLFLVVNFLSERGSGGERSVRFLPGLLAGLIFLLHPFNAEVVNYVTARSSVMAAFFYLLSFYGYVQYRHGARPRLFLAVSLVSFLLGLLTKEILITLPLLFLLYEGFLPAGNDFLRKRLYGIVPFFFLSLVYLWVRKEVVGSVAPSFLIRDFGENLLIQAKALAVTWQMLFFPLNLSIEHPVPENHGVGDPVLWGALLLLSVSLAAVVGGWSASQPKFRVAGFWLAWFYLTQLPTVLIPLHAVIQENRGYIAAAAFAGILGIFLSELMDRSPAGRRAATVVLGILIVGYGIGVWDRNRVWGDEVTLWQDAVQKAPGVYGTHYGLATAFQRKGEWERAEAEFLMALHRGGEKDPMLHNDLGVLTGGKGRTDEALRHFREAIRLNPGNSFFYGNLGLHHEGLGQDQAAIEAYEAALRINPLNETVLIHLGGYYSRRREPERARDLYRSALRRNADLPRVQLAAGLLDRKMGDHRGAMEAFQAAVSLNPSLVEAHIGLGEEYLLLNKPREASESLLRALALRPEDGFGYLTLGKLYEQMGERDKARKLYGKVLSLNPELGRNREAISMARKELGGGGL